MKEIILMKHMTKVPDAIKVMVVLFLTMALSAPLAFGKDAIPKMDKHQSKGVACATCHKTMPFTRTDDATCMGCHGSYAQLAEKTARLEDLKAGVQNPHKSHIGEARCTLCHKNHAPSVLHCNDCHKPKFDMKVP